MSVSSAVTRSSRVLLFRGVKVRVKDIRSRVELIDRRRASRFTNTCSVLLKNTLMDGDNECEKC